MSKIMILQFGCYMDKIDYSKITDNPKVVELLKKRNEIEKEIREIEEMALVKYELALLQIGRL